MLRPSRRIFSTGRWQTPTLRAPPSSTRQFTSTRPLGDPTHYDILSLPPDATAKQIKSQFYALSKSHHPDLHPNDPDASSRFVRISEAYAVLGSAEKRAKYDRSMRPAAGDAEAAPRTPRGSHSSHTAGPAGGRSATGLSRRRTQFRGPPPSFYRSGGWGVQGAKRQEYQGRTAEAAWGGQGQGFGQSGAAYKEPGTGPGGFGTGFDNDVPHFDREGHYRTHEGMEGRRQKVRREVEDGDSGSVTAGFFGVTAVLLAIIGASALLGESVAPAGKGVREVRGREGSKFTSA